MPDRPCHEPADEDCHWHSTGLGSMTIVGTYVYDDKTEYVLWRQMTGRDAVHCGTFRKKADAERIARILAKLDDGEFNVP